MSEATVETVPELEERTETFRVLQRDENTVDSVTRWIEREPLEMRAKYPYPSAPVVGEKYGEGDFILLQDGQFARAQTMKVAADRYYREVTEGDESA